jgi:tetratricopeptide (TPR) repeat protein
MLTTIDESAVDKHWRTQLDFERPAQGAALRMHGLSAALDQVESGPRDEEPLSFPQFAYLAPAGTREYLWKAAGRHGDPDDELLQQLAKHGSGAARLVLAIKEFAELDISAQCRVIATLLECALYDSAAELVEAHDIELDASSAWGAWCLYQVARLQQRTDGVLGQPDEFFVAVAESAPLGWQRAAAMGQLIARYARISPSRGALAHWSGLARVAVAEQGTSASAVDCLWASRVCRALALGHSVVSDSDAAASALMDAGWFHRAAAQCLPSNSANTYLLAMNERLLIEAQLKLSPMVGEVRTDLVDQILALDPGCADTWYFAGSALAKAGDFERAADAHTQSYRLGTMRSAQAAAALARLWSDRDVSTAREWAHAACRIPAPTTLPSDIIALAQEATHAA